MSGANAPRDAAFDVPAAAKDGRARVGGGIFPSRPDRTAGAKSPRAAVGPASHAVFHAGLCAALTVP